VLFVRRCDADDYIYRRPRRSEPLVEVKGFRRRNTLANLRRELASLQAQREAAQADLASKIVWA